MPGSRQIEGAAGDAGAEGRDEIAVDDKRIEVAVRHSSQGVHGLTCRGPIDPSIPIDLQRILGAQCTDPREPQIPHLQRRLKEANVAMAEHCRAVQVPGHDPRTVGGNHDGIVNAGMIGVDNHPTRQKKRREPLRRFLAPAHFDINAANDRAAGPYGLK